MQETKKTKPQNSFLWTIVYPVLIGLAIAYLIERTIFFTTGILLPSIVNVLIYLVFYFVAALYLKKFRNKEKVVVPHPALEWPRSGPIGKFGSYGLAFTFLPTSILSVLNPWQLVQQIKQLSGMAAVSKRVKETPEVFEQYKTKIAYVYPFQGEWLIFNGGYSEQTSHSWDVLTQRYAFDFVKADNNFSRHSGRGSKLTDYHCYNEPITSAADGEVVSVKNGINPAPLVGWGVADFLCLHFAGNHVIVKHADGEYGFYAHLVRDSIEVKPGDKIKQGNLIGLCGHTGHSTEPHLHFHLQDGPDLFTAMGLPIVFNNQRIERGHFVSNPESEISPDQAQVV